MLTISPASPGTAPSPMVDVADPDGGHAHDAHHRFLREGKWDMAQLWRRLAPLLVSHLEGTLHLVLDLDDTLFHKAGPKVNGAGSFRDPIRSRGQRTVFAHGLNLVVLTLRVQPPWGGEPIGLPVNMRRYSKRDGRSLLDLGQDMLEEVAGWLPDHSFILGCDGAYSSLAGRDLPRTHVVSRIQRNAALYEPAPPRRPGQRGRPPQSAVGSYWRPIVPNVIAVIHQPTGRVVRMDVGDTYRDVIANALQVLNAYLVVESEPNDPLHPLRS